MPNTWAAPFVAWGEENRGTALRLIRDNLEIKCFDPALLGDVQRLPTSLREAVDEIEEDAVLTQAFGQELAGTIADVRRGEMERYKDASPQAIADVTRWRY